MEKVKLTSYSKASGCGCKIAPAVLGKILDSNLNLFKGKNLLVGNETSDDAAVYDLGNEIALISTTDFFTPIVDDPYSFGRIAAANALSDVYAMGGTPIMALSILGWPTDKLPIEIAQLVTKGAVDACTEAGIQIAGGHSIESQEPIFGLSVNGLVKKSNIKTNGGAKTGDVICLTKSIGTGILSAAEKRDKLRVEDLGKAAQVMMKLNSIGAKLGELDFVHALTDITGFGLLGHLVEVCKASGVSAEMNYEAVPKIDGIDYYIQQYIVPDNTYRNWNAYEKEVSGNVATSFFTLCDPQTNGGLLISVDKSKLGSLKDLFAKEKLELFVIGEMRPKLPNGCLVDIC
ncbi:MAG: selenide, water dikinase SelD [Bacteroidetes bacterium]|nr:selenide, water dikinase SelD [Bacteroidota bacterium]